MLNIPEIFGFLMNSSKISSNLRQFCPNSDLKSSNGSIPRRSNLSTQAWGAQLRAALRLAGRLRRQLLAMVAGGFLRASLKMCFFVATKSSDYSRHILRNISAASLSSL